MDALFLAWQDPETRRWIPVGKLTKNDIQYCFVYTKGALASELFVPFDKMENLYVAYESEELFPLFANRLMPKSRPEYDSYLKWLNLDKDDNDFMMLALTNRVRETDSLELFPNPAPTANHKYFMRFFNHGLRYLDQHVIERVNKLEPGDRLYVMNDCQNEKDRCALALRTCDPATIIGYCPRYLVESFQFLLKDNSSNVAVRVEKVNLEAPLQNRLLCNITADWPDDFQPNSGEEFQPLA